MEKERGNNKGGAPIGNDNADKITLEDARNLCLLALDTISDDCYFLSSVAEKCKTYRQKFEYVLKKFDNDEVVFNTIKRMYNKCESIVMEKTAKGEIVPALGIFVLKSYHGLMESSRQQIDHTTNGKDINERISINFFDSDGENEDD